MTTSEAVAELLPKLRRYARALTGSQSSGDTCVGATLKALADDPGMLGEERNPRIAVFNAFSRVWGLTGGSKRGEPANPDGPEKHLIRLTPRSREAFLLVAMEGFSEEEAAEILGIGVPELRRFVEDSGRELAAEIATDVLIIEDEPMIAMNLQGLVEGLGHSVTGIARTHAEAVALAKAHQPGLILSDIRLADMSSGIDAVNELLQLFPVPVIFITAYPERFLTGERPEPTFLIPKPFLPAMVSAVISQALFFEQKAQPPSPAVA